MEPGIAEVARKAGVLWVELPGRAPLPVWQVWRDGASYLLTGPGEQPLPGLAEAGAATVIARSPDTGGRAATWPVTVRVLAGAERAEVLPALATARLNGSPDPGTAVVLELRPGPCPSPAPPGE